jgi:2-iminobutanoate/2-iminopropanoate deaminase
MSRRSITVQGLEHPGLPIPCAARVGPLLATGGIRGVDRQSGAMPPDAAGQVRLMFDNLAAIVAEGGGTLDDVAKVTVWVVAAEVRAAVNSEWVQRFPDARSRPARHITEHALPGGMLVQCDALAFIGNGQD